MSIPQHHLHTPSEPLPPPVPAEVTTSACPCGAGHDSAACSHNQADVPQVGIEQEGRNAFNSERPLGVAPVPEGGVAIGGQPDLPEGHATLGDKIVGKTQKVIGKYTNNPELHEKGELRETGGKASAEGRARAAHD